MPVKWRNFDCLPTQKRANSRHWGIARTAEKAGNSGLKGGRMKASKLLLCSIVAPIFAAQAQDVPAIPPTEAMPVPLQEAQPAAALAKPLPAGTPVFVALDTELSTQTSTVGDSFSVTVSQDVMQDGIVVIPKGVRGRGEITFLTKKGGFGKPGIIGIALRDMELNGRQVLLDGRFREEGGNNNAATAATWLAVGVISGLVQGKSSVIPAGRELKGRTGEDIAIPAESVEPMAAETTAEAAAPAAEAEAIKTGEPI
jgi:hypothetical protein